jgi:hypothetical protein
LFSFIYTSFTPHSSSPPLFVHLSTTPFVFWHSDTKKPLYNLTRPNQYPITTTIDHYPIITYYSNKLLHTLILFPSPPL